VTTPQIPDRNQIVTPPILKTHIQCCSYTCSQGIPKPWQCPGCQKWHNLDAPLPP
jgi:hypothetical protein